MNDKLRKELMKMAEEDQNLLNKLIQNGELKEKEYHPAMKAVHEKNNTRIKEIIDEHGWPGFNLVGKDGSEAAWLIVQHAVLEEDFMIDCLDLLKEAVEKNDAEGWCYAYLQDRVLTMQNKLQIYGTQHEIDENGIACSLPSENPGQVDKLREEIGIEPLHKATERIQERHDLNKSNNK